MDTSAWVPIEGTIDWLVDRCSQEGVDNYWVVEIHIDSPCRKEGGNMGG